MNEESTDKAQRDASNVYSRRKFMQVATVTAGSALLVACNSQSPPVPPPVKLGPTIAPAAVTATAQASLGKTYFPSPAPGVPDAYTVPLPAFQSVNSAPGHGEAVSVFSITFIPPETPHGMNRYWQELEKLLNISSWNISHALGNQNYAVKVGTLLASGNLPDLFLINTGLAPTLIPAISQGAFTDLTSYLSGSTLNDYPNIARFPSQLWKNVAINGKIYGVPRPFGFTTGTLLYRKDWAQKVGIPNPKNGNDFFKMLHAFTQNGVWGMGFSGSGIANSPFFMNMFNVPNQWRQEKNKSLTYFIQTDEYKQAVAYMTKLYAGGVFHPNSLTQTGLQTKQSFLAGKIGAYVDGFSAWPDQRTKIKTLDSNADVEILVPFAANGGKASYWLSSGFSGFTGIPSSVSDSGRVKELLHILDYLAAPKFSVEANFLSLGIEGWDSKVGKNGVQSLTPTGTNEIGSLVNPANGAIVYYYPAEPSLGPIAQEYTRRLLAIGVTNPVAGLMSPTALKQQATLDTLIGDRVLRIIKGIDPLSALNTLIAEWKSQGGTQIAQEYTKALNG